MTVLCGAVGVRVQGCDPGAMSPTSVVLQRSLPAPGGAVPCGGGERALVQLGGPWALLPLLWWRRGHPEETVQ